jgi:hypothetical protein
MTDTIKTVEGNKTVYRRSWEHSVYNGYTITKTEVDVYRMSNGKVSGGSIRYEWTATDGTSVAEAKTLKVLKQRIDLM